MILTVPDTVVAGAEGTKNTTISKQLYPLPLVNYYNVICTGSCTAICVNPHVDHLYLVGTEEGKVFKCSKVYKDHYLDIYEVIVTQYLFV